MFPQETRAGRQSQFDSLTTGYEQAVWKLGKQPSEHRLIPPKIKES